jgi:hypothetical protein
MAEGHHGSRGAGNPPESLWVQRALAREGETALSP